MKRFLITSLFLLLSNVVFAQRTIVSSKKLSKQNIDSIFTVSLKSKLQLDYPIYRVYEFTDSAGKHFVVMTEKPTFCEGKKECFDAIKTFCYSYNNNTFKLEWDLKDFILHNSHEYSINHWTKYFEIADYDKDGIADPIITYGTLGMNEFDDGRIKILIYYKGKKRAIRHQNGVHDEERNTKVDELFYEIPREIQIRVKFIMESITENNHGIFPNGWQKAMENKKVWFDEN